MFTVQEKRRARPPSYQYGTQNKTQERCSVRMLGHMMGVQNKIDKMQVAWRLALIIVPTYSQCRSTALCQGK